MADLLPPQFADRARLDRMVRGAIRDALVHHPEYLTRAGSRYAVGSITKRVTGTLLGHVIQTREGGPCRGGGCMCVGGRSSPHEGVRLPAADASGRNCETTGNEGGM